MITSASCSWCHTLVTLNYGTTCPTCGHKADRSRLDCDCDTCRRYDPPGDRDDD